VGYLHEFIGCQTKQSLVYDLQEPFGWLVDLSVIQAFESKTLDLHDFYFTGDDYRYRFEPDARQRFIDLIRERFNSGVSYKGRVLRWDTIIEQKAMELSRALINGTSAVDFATPSPKLERVDGQDIRTKILALTSSQAKQIGIGRSTLHHLRKKAKANRSFNVYSATRTELQSLS